MSVSLRRSTAASGSSSVSEKRKPLMSNRSAESFQSLTKNPFLSLYTSICGKYKTRPVPFVKINGKANSIEILGDRMKVEDWQAAMEALSAAVSTHLVRIKNKRHVENLEKNYDTFSSVIGAPKNIPASSTLYVVRLIAYSVNDLLNHSHALVCLELENVLFDEQAMEIIISDVKNNHTLQHLSLAYSRVGDGACMALCRVLRYKPNVRSVDLTGCSLTPSSANLGLVDLIKKQQFKRHEECWAHSLRLRSANPNVMHGLRRITLNDNPGLGDEGVAELFESLKDDLYIKALDLQNCSLTDRAAQLALSTLMVNDTLVVLDVRKNPLVSSVMLETVMTRLYENNGKKPEAKHWKWTKLGREIAFESSDSVL